MTDLAIVKSGAYAPDFAALEELDDGMLDELIGICRANFEIFWRHTIEQAWQLGQLLAEKKKRLGHGNWLNYVDECLPFKHDQALDLMNLGQADDGFIRNLPAGTSVTEAIKAWQRSQRTPRPLPPPSNGAPQIVPQPRFAIDMDAADVVSAIVRVCFPEARTGLDPTYGSGNFHNGSLSLEITAHDIDPTRAPNGAMDVTDLKYGDLSFDVVLFDPPHLADLGSESIFGDRFGTGTAADIQRVIQLGARECWRVAGIGLVVKITDHVHNQVFVSESDMVNDALGWPPLYELAHQVRSKGLTDGRWLEHEPYSLFNNGATYLIFKRGGQRHEG